MNVLTYVSSSQHKFAEIQAALPSFRMQWLATRLPEKLSISPREILTAKARIAFCGTQAPFVMDHSAIYFSQYDYKLPGCLIEPMMNVLGLDGICRLISKNRLARSQTLMLLCDGRKFIIFDAVTEGSIVEEPRGHSGFGWDAVFVPAGSSKTYAEMQIEEKQVLSSRTKVCKQLETRMGDG